MEEREQRDLARMQRVCPRWLHVLMPADNQRSEDTDAPEELKELRLLKKQLQGAEEALASRQAKVLEAVGKRDEQGERQKMLQAIRVELATLREDVVSAVKR